VTGSGGPPEERTATIRFLAFVALLVIVAVAYRVSPLGSDAGREQVAEALDGWRGRPWAPFAFVAFYAALQSVGVPALILSLTGGALFGVVFGAMLNVTGATIGACGAFLLARGLGRD